MKSIILLKNVCCLLLLCLFVFAAQQSFADVVSPRYYNEKKFNHTHKRRLPNYPKIEAQMSDNGKYILIKISSTAKLSYHIFSSLKHINDGKIPHHRGGRAIERINVNKLKMRRNDYLIKVKYTIKLDDGDRKRSKFDDDISRELVGSKDFEIRAHE